LRALEHVCKIQPAAIVGKELQGGGAAGPEIEHGEFIIGFEAAKHIAEQPAFYGGGVSGAWLRGVVHSTTLAGHERGCHPSV
jgi:hypothetical protein